MDKFTLLSLPDDVLLAVLAHLPARELFSCRVVCVRLRDLCLHRELWRTVRVRDSGVVRAALRLAPCIGEVWLSWANPLAPLPRPRTACVVEELHVSVEARRDVPLAVNTVQHLGAGGGVRKLDISMEFIPAKKMMPLLKAVCGIKGLQELTVDVRYSDEPAAFFRQQQAEPSLTKLVYQSQSADPFLVLLLKTHAATLQEVRLAGLQDLPAALLAGVPGLRTLHCAPRDDLPLLLTLANLQSIVLTDLKRNVTPPGARDFLAQASHLRSVALHLTPAVSKSLLLALGRSRSAGLVESIVVATVLDLALEDLVVVLRRFPSLRSFDTLYLSADSLLKAISPESAPSLTTLSVVPRASCLHSSIHQDAVLDLLLRNPRLHLRLYPPTVLHLDVCPCEWCVKGCHKELKAPFGLLRLAFSSHRRGAGCPRGCYQLVVPHS
ncbi:uncharacterized protein LOC117652571 [Thrips palmi]|uniref:Uncharacterized protein LOC117652571 n=1 Tax=Thrips palmi TaxID=161013 RepID=A0A6P9A6F0_THRPL|nr:uncharacterized protein LOC117652571 [Thrips palmi]XP_034253482.1 uncharacterized protein LOC117652571 [Thrips palmi]XP_034253483.1 uncharacterized protein LOC117652571 [Thrips palmi]XP_034253484.1 uncharacterized protein LOC117652571 [Thrips palmi]XP_034253485.1 uncharacterized protein LOC117652571 [Thrips palmi]XP_034253486.1 uncharacterized protein LOC117652571 [Thrips palmi]XP_034253488.1 uncharacterized protein LOC117652571 [Thrips palmi]XP_034253489.1 uncharacterized protein LOC1176